MKYRFSKSRSKLRLAYGNRQPPFESLKGRWTDKEFLTPQEQYALNRNVPWEVIDYCKEHLGEFEGPLAAVNILVEQGLEGFAGLVESDTSCFEDWFWWENTPEGFEYWEELYEREDV